MTYKKWLGAKQATIHYLNKLWGIYVSIIFVELFSLRVPYNWRISWNLYWESWENVAISFSDMSEISVESEILHYLTSFKPATMAIICATVLT